MIVTELQAKQKVCPLMSTIRDVTWCKASHCMKWRWLENHSPEEIASRKEFGMPSPAEPKGYCGA